MYLPAPNFFGEDRFLVRVSDGTSIREFAVRVTVNPVNDPPLFQTPQHFTISEGSTLSDNIDYLEVDGDPMTFFAGPPEGSVTVNPDGSQVVSAGGSSFTLRNRDFNTLSFRSNVVLRWEWRTGSTIYLVWQQDRAGTEITGSRVGVGDAFRSLTAPGAHIFLIKTSFWVPVK